MLPAQVIRKHRKHEQKPGILSRLSQGASDNEREILVLFFACFLLIFPPETSPSASSLMRNSSLDHSS
jgi:hypothetical protein